MRLLDTSTARFRHIDNANQAPYAILSHVWDHADGEQSLQASECSSDEGFLRGSK